MKFKFVVLVVICNCIFLFASCGSQRTLDESSYLLKAVEKYCEKEEIEPIKGFEDEQTNVISYSNDEEFGIVGFFRNKETGDIKIIKNSVAKEDNKGIFNVQIENDGKNYLGVSLPDDKKIKSITVKFMKNSTINEISVTHTKGIAEVITYSSDELLDVQSIILLNENGSEIYSKKK